MLILMEKGQYSADTATIFEFVDFNAQAGKREITFSYKVHFVDAEPLNFSETIILSRSDWMQVLDPSFRQCLLEDLHLILGISYYKLFCPKTFKGYPPLSESQTLFWNSMYTKGLGEFLYRNGINRKNVASFTSSSDAQRKAVSLKLSPRSLLVGIGGGKDSIVSLELLNEYERTGFVVETGKSNPIAAEVALLAKVPLTTVTRTLDPQLITGVEGSYKGHVPISAVYAFLGVLEAALGGHAYIVVSNEHSSNFGNLMHEGNEVNHQWSKSSEFEKLFQSYVRSHLTPSITYFSLLRPFYELRIVKLFTEIGKKYFHTFSSCNRNFTHTHTEGGSRWCGECPKCAFAFLMLSAFLPKEEVIAIFKKDLFEDRSLQGLFNDILGYGDLKPFDCVGTFDESRVALLHARNSWSDSYMVQALLPQLGTETLSIDVFTAEQALTIPSQFRLLGMESVLILGYGKEGHANEIYLKTRYPKLGIGIADQQDGPNYLEKQHAYDVVVKTPVIPHTKVLRQYVTGTQLFFTEVRREMVIGVTGSKGKSTTATLLYLMLKKAGVSVRLIGNIGVPALQEILDRKPKKDELFVFELSSYQLEDLDISPHITVVTSLFPEHLDHHGSLESYYEAKHNIMSFQEAGDTFVSAEGFPLLSEWGKGTQATTVTPKPLPFEIDNQALRGQHMKSNVALAYTVAKMCNADDAKIEEVVNSFQGLPHRLELVGTHKEIEFYDDSISTTPESTIAGLHALKNVNTIILGGVDRGYDFTELEKELRTQGVKNVILFPESGERMLTSEEGFNVLHTFLMEEAVQFAYAHTQKGKACLLSPSAPSYNLFKNFEERGDVFKAAVKKYGTH